MVAVAKAPGKGRLLNAGPVLPVVVAGPSGAFRTMALVDTGAATTSVDEDILKRVGATLVGSSTVDGATGRAELPVYTARITTVDGQVLLNGQARTLGTQLPESCQVLIGRDVLSGLQFNYSGSGGHWSFGSPSDHCGCHKSLWQTAAAVTVGHLAAVGSMALFGAIVGAARR